MRISIPLLLIVFLCWFQPAQAQRKSKDKTPAKTEEKDTPFKSSTFSGLKLRNVGPALTSGRIADFAVNPHNRFEYYVAVASGGVWKTSNAGTTFKPICDRKGSYSIGCVSLAPSNPNIVWVGTGENNAQRSVAYGDGVYRSLDGGQSFQHMGLKESEHIGMITIHPENPEVVFVAAQGPLWSAGGDRGLYKSMNGGQNWRKVLEVSEHGGVNEVFMDPRNPEIMYASTWQRRRHVWTFISGGPESAIYKSTDGGETWFKSQKGLPSGDLGRIGMAISPVNPDVLYAIVQASGDKGGFFRSTDRGASWQKRGDYTTSGNYYQEIICDPVDLDRVYSMNTYGMVTNDGGKTWVRLGEKSKHVDNHCIWIDPDHPDYYLIGCDGGIYESYDRAANWHFKANLPVTQFYKVATDNAEPFYNIYGGTQDNFSLGGPSRTTNSSGIVNADWYVTNGGDGFESQVDPNDPNIVYAQSQYGGLVRYDRQSGERVDIQPQPGKDEAAFRWNWDAPLVISPHSPTRLYFAANKVFKSDDRGHSWQAISEDLSRQIDRNQLPVMGKVWGMDAVQKNVSTTIYGNIVALDESPLQEGLLYVGTDDGLVHVSENDGEEWRTISQVPGVPETTYVNMLLPSQHEAGTVYAVFNNHKNGDFKPYVFKSTDKGQSWQAISSNLPERGSAYAIAEDHVDPNLLFVGTEFGLFFSSDGGTHWTQLKSGLPTIAIRDIAIQRRENDLVLASFGRGFYVLDDYSPLRNLTKESLEQTAHIFPIKDAWMFNPSSPIGNGYGRQAFQGSSYYTADNPPVGAVFTYYLKEKPKTLKEQRQKKEQELAKEGEAIPYPSFAEMRAEDNEEKPFLLFTITDGEGNVVRKLKTNATAGIKRISWDFRYPSTSPINVGSGNRPRPRGSGHLALPGDYFVSLSQSVNGEITQLVEPQKFTIKPLNNATLPAEDIEAKLAFEAKAAELRRAISAANAVRSDMAKRVNHIKAAILAANDVPTEMMQEAKAVEVELQRINIAFNGDRSVSSRQFETPPSLNRRIGDAVYGPSRNSSAPTETAMEQYEIAAAEFEGLLASLKDIVKQVQTLEEKLDASNAPYTPGRLPNWERE
jgi:photosystem II stability/assembly factor-like uncharacterized protein